MGDPQGLAHHRDITARAQVCCILKQRKCNATALGGLVTRDGSWKGKDTAAWGWGWLSFCSSGNKLPGNIGHDDRRDELRTVEGRLDMRG